jgi:hypothetical protein
MSYAPTTDLNAFLRDLEQAATETGWMLVAYEGRLPGYVLLMDASGTEVRITNEYGLGLVEQIRNCTPTKAYTR